MDDSELEDYALNVTSEEEEDEDEDEYEDDDVEFEEENQEDASFDLGSQLSHFHQFDRVDYEALATEKRKRLAINSCSGSGKKARLEDMYGASKDEIEEAMNYVSRRKSRKTKIRGRRKGSKGKLSPQVTRLLGDATVLYAHGRYEEAIPVLLEVIKLAAHVPDSYHTLGLVLMALGDTENAMKYYEIAAWLMPKDSPLWKTLFAWHSERGDVARARLYLSKAVKADPNDVALRVLHASYFVKLGNWQKAAQSYEWISKTCPEDVEALKIAAKLYSDSGQKERGINILEDYLKSNQTGSDIGVIELLADLLMETNAHDIALQCIEHTYLDWYEGKEIPFQLKIKAGICYLHLGNIEKAEVLFTGLEGNIGSSHSRLIADVANAFMNVGHFHGALKFYHILEPITEVDNVGHINLKIAQCYLSLCDRVKAVKFFYKALHALEDSVGCRLDLTSLLIEDGKEDEAIALLLPPENSDSVDVISAQHKSWWLDGKIKLKLCYIYRAKGMLKDFVDTILPFIRDSLCAKPPPQKAKKRLTIGILRKRTKILDVGDGDQVFGGVRPLASRSDLMKASRAKRTLKKMKEEAKAAGIDWHSDDSDNQSSEEEARDPPLPNFLKDEEHYKLILDLCKALQSLERYWEALELIDLIRRFAYKKLPVDVKEELQSLSAQMSYKTTDPKHGFECMRSIVVKHPYSVAAWNCYYKITSRLGKSYSKYGKFLRYMRNKHADCVPPILITGHHFSMGSYYQDAAREYLAAYKLQPESPLVNLCVGTSLVNLALGFRLQNKNQCLAQGFSFLYKNLQMAENSKVSLQEALYNIARAYHHVGLITLAASYYEKVLQIYEKDCPIPKLLNENSDAPENLHPGYCDLRREAAYNLHLIYKKSGAIDLARQILKDHCTF